MSGLAPPGVPREENGATAPVRPIAATVDVAGYGAGASSIDPQRGPSLPAAATKKIPAAVSASTAGASARRSQPSVGGQPHEFVSTSAARAGSPWNASPPGANGASMNWRQSR